MKRGLAALKKARDLSLRANSFNYLMALAIKSAGFQSVLYFRSSLLDISRRFAERESKLLVKGCFVSSTS